MILFRVKQSINPADRKRPAGSLSTLENDKPGLVHVGQVCYLRCVVTARELDSDGTALAWVEYVGRDGFTDPDAFPRVYAVPESHLVASKIVAEEMK